ncbi:LOW QUALITY PROTEIN: intraflagellar transport protein 122 homolog [Pollicipes pollicipes]|uniref:LOW QUALITY PROTEIN: intraflagellar transport protein 122 homolog n=1 Tax=Pollicipes pollicipes TaxID=41117 RepID=UPI00188535B1|nr:LOW QUALITY PROTEIN: intraflagellar transport protein 122 homolog [Pollicipes pollicipes]
MRTVTTWVDKVHDKDKNEQPIHDMCFHPDGTMLVVAAGNRVLVYDAVDGSLIQPLKGHTGNVYCVAYSRDGKRFASGSQDKSVIIWATKGTKVEHGVCQIEGILRYTHKDAVQCIAYNPLSLMLVSCSLSDFGLWSPEQKNVTKYSVPSRVNSCTWTTDGLLFALGLMNGSVSIRNKQGEEKARIERPGGSSSPVWRVHFSPVKEDVYDVLAVADWGQTLSFYSVYSKDFKVAEIGKERQLRFDACTMQFFPLGQYILMGGSNRECTLFTKEGIRLETISAQESWVWCAAPRPDSNYVACGCNDGTIAYYQLVFSTVHGLHRERYAFRENMTDVIIEHLITEQKVRIKCRDMVKKIALYKTRLAVQLPERVIIYELYTGDSTDMHYRVKEKLNQKLECSLLVICANHLVLCQDRRLQCLNLSGEREREWVMDSMIRYIKVIGGPPDRECLLIGLKNGHVYKIFIDNAFPVSLLKVPSAIRCLDLSAYKEKLAVVDDNGTVLVYSVESKELMFQEPNASSLSFNTMCEDMLCYSGNGVLFIKAASYVPYQQKLPGFVVGFSGSKVFVLWNYSMRSIDVLQSAPMYQYIDKKLFSQAYAVACLGVSESDWETLGTEALNNLELEVAKKSYMRIKDVPWLYLIDSMEERKKKGDFNEQVFLGDILSYRGEFREAAECYQKGGKPSAALQMYTDLRMFDLAQEFAGDEDSSDRKTLLKKRAEWAKNINELRSAAEMYVNAGETLKAIEIMGENGWIDMLIETGRKLDKGESQAIELVAQHLRRLKQYALAAEMYKKMDDTESMISCYVEAEAWDEAFALGEQHPEFRQIIYVPYANWLAEHDKFLEAQKAFHKAGRLDLAFLILDQLTVNAVEESRFDDAAFYHWVLSLQCLEVAKEDAAQKDAMIKLFYEHQRKANIYYAYHTIHRYIEEPFTSYMPEALFNIARFLTHELTTLQPRGVSKFCTLYALAKQGKILEAFKLARYALDKIQQLKVPLRFQENVDLASVQLRGKAFTDKEELLPLCYRCSSVNPLINTRGSRCTNCNQPFVFSFVSFEILTLVEFQLEDGISDEDAMRMIELSDPDGSDDEESSSSSSSSEEDEDEEEKPAQLSISAAAAAALHPNASGAKQSASGAKQSASGTKKSASGIKKSASTAKKPKGWKEKKKGTTQTLTLNDPNAGGEADPFTERLLNFEQGGTDFIPVVVNAPALRAMSPVDVLVCKWPPPLRYQFFRNLMPDMPVSHCLSCNRLFHTDDYELQSLQKGYCPFLGRKRPDPHQALHAGF